MRIDLRQCVDDAFQGRLIWINAFARRITEASTLKGADACLGRTTRYSLVKIAFVVTRSDTVGGAQVHIRDLGTSLREAGHEPIVLAGGDGPWFDQLRERHIPIIPLRHMGRSISPVADVRALFELRRRLKQLQPDVVSTHTAKGGVLGRIAAASLRIPVLFTAHGWTFTDGISRLQARVWRFAERLVGRLAGRIVTVSEFDRRLALSARITSPDRVLTIHNGMPDTPEILRAHPGIEPPQLVMVARFEAQKDHRTLLLALAALRDKPWSLSLIGNGPLESSMKALCRDLDLQDRVTFLGARSDVAEILARSQIFILCTHWEGLPRSIIEAMRAGLPVLATAVAGIPELIDDGVSGLMCRPQDVEDATNQLRILLDSPSRRIEMGRQARQRYLDHFQFERMLARTLQTYDAVVASQGSRARRGSGSVSIAGPSS